MIHIYVNIYVTIRRNVVRLKLLALCLARELLLNAPQNRNHTIAFFVILQLRPSPRFFAKTKEKDFAVTTLHASALST